MICHRALQSHWSTIGRPVRASVAVIGHSHLPAAGLVIIGGRRCIVVVEVAGVVAGDGHQWQAVVGLVTTGGG